MGKKSVFLDGPFFQGSQGDVGRFLCTSSTLEAGWGCTKGMGLETTEIWEGPGKAKAISVSSTMAKGYGKGIPEGRAMSSWMWLSLSVLLVASLVLLWYPALYGSFVFDDEILIVRNPLVHGPLDLGGIFGGRFLGASVGQESVPFWRPVTVLVFWGLWHLGNGTALAFHAFALGVHVLGALLGLRLLFRLGLSPLLAGLAVFAFAAHPAQVEGLSWVSAGSLPLMEVLLLTFLLAWERFLREGGVGTLVGGTLAFALALLVREEAIIGILLAALLEVFSPAGAKTGKRAWKRWGLLVGVTLLWFFARHFALSQAASRGHADTRGVWEAFVLRLHILGVHLRDLCLPRELDVLRPLPMDLFGPGSGLGVSLVWVGGFLALLLGLRCRRGLLWILFCLLPLLLVGEGTGVTPLADRYHAFAALGLALFLADLWRLPWGKWISPTLLLASCALYLPVTRAGIKPWKDPRSFWEHASFQNPDSVLAAYSLGRQRLMDYERGGNPRNLEGAAEALDRAMALRRSFGSRSGAEKVQELAIETARAWVQLTQAMRSKRVSPRSARGSFERILKKAPRSADAWVGMGVALMLEQRVGEAETAFRKAVELDPGNPQARFNLARLLLAKGERTEAGEQLQEVLRIQPGNQGAQQLLRRLKGW